MEMETQRKDNTPDSCMNVCPVNYQAHKTD